MESKVFLTYSQNKNFCEGYGKSFKQENNQGEGMFADAVSKAGNLEQSFDKGKDVQGKQSIRQYREKVFDQIAANAPKSVKQAWLDAADVVGVDGMGVSDSGKLSHISQLMVRRVEQGYRGENVSSILGNSVQSAIRVANEALYALEHPLDSNRGRTAEQIENRMKEKMFYQEFIKRLSAI
ncbi:MAG: hypothetical protein K2J99_14610 [Lachnospiraceae bacterium]|nr:hypothetical protein [Lachnospiraceae bacterium]